MLRTFSRQRYAASAPAAVGLESVTKKFGDVLAVDDLTLEIPSGSFFALLGPSGCGKTTTLRMIGGFEEPDAGTIEVGGKPVTGVPPYKREVNTVFQSYALFPHLNVFENVAFGLRRKKVPKQQLTRAHARDPAHRRARGVRRAQAEPAVRWAAAARRARASAREQPEGAAARRAARRTRPEAPQADAARAEAHPERAGAHLRPRHARPGGSDDDGRRDRGHEPRQDRAARLSHRSLRAAAHRLRRRASSASRTCSTARSRPQAPCASTKWASCASAPSFRPPERACGSGFGRSSSGWTRPARTRSRAPIAERAYIGVATQYIVDTSAGKLTVFVQSSGAAVEGDNVTVSWDPDSTFVVEEAT